VTFSPSLMKEMAEAKSQYIADVLVAQNKKSESTILLQPTATCPERATVVSEPPRLDAVSAGMPRGSDDVACMDSPATCMLSVALHGQLDGVCLDSMATCMHGVASHEQLNGVNVPRMHAPLVCSRASSFRADSPRVSSSTARS
jgi:hypothetical protein